MVLHVSIASVTLEISYFFHSLPELIAHCSGSCCTFFLETLSFIMNSCSYMNIFHQQSFTRHLDHWVEVWCVGEVAEHDSSEKVYFCRRFVAIWQPFAKIIPWLYTCRCCLHDLFTWILIWKNRSFPRYYQNCVTYSSINICVQVWTCRNETETRLIHFNQLYSFFLVGTVSERKIQFYLHYLLVMLYSF
jgi:hypothetical protein